MIAAEKSNYPVAVMCRVLRVSRTGFHNWERRAPSDRALSDVWLTERIREIHDASRGVYGAPRVHAELQLEHEIRVGRKRVARLMKAAGIAGVRPRKRWKTTIRIPGITPATDLVERDFNPSGPNVLWVADITYLRTWEGWLFLATVIDIASRRVVGFALADHLRTELVADALANAVAARGPDPGVIFHSDRGCQYTSAEFTGLAEDCQVVLSLGRKGQCWDNALAESFFASLKGELTDNQAWPTRAGARRAIVEYIGWYNGTRLHSTLDYRSPAEFEASARKEALQQVA